MFHKFSVLLGILVSLVSCKSSGNDAGTSASIEKEPLSINWSKDVPSKHDIINGSAVTYHDEIYVLAGQEGRFMKYNPTTYVWVDLAGLPGPRTEPAMTLWNDKIVVAGGVDDSSHIVKRVDYYDLKDQVWKYITPLPEGRCRFSLLAYDDKLFAIGGSCGENEQSNKNCDKILYYHEESRNWNVQTTLTSGRNSQLAVNKGDELYLIGGYGADPKTGTIYINHTKKEFGFLPGIPSQRGNFGGTLVGDYILTFGGKTKSNYSPVEKFDTKTKKWLQLDNCPFWTDRFAFARWKDRVYVFGGSQFPKQVWKGDIVFK
ncbi:MAG: hypothetical protein ABI844_13360 [Saprospiraceae bacterium]